MKNSCATQCFEKLFLVLIWIESSLDSRILSLESWSWLFLNLDSWNLILESWILILENLILESLEFVRLLITFEDIASTKRLLHILYVQSLWKCLWNLWSPNPPLPFFLKIYGLGFKACLIFYLTKTPFRSFFFRFKQVGQSICMNSPGSSHFLIMDYLAL